MGDTLAGLGGFALIAGLFVAYALERRRARAKKNPPPAPPPVASPAPIAATPTTAEPVRQGRSPNWGAPIVYCLLLTFAATHRDSFWGYLWQTSYLAFVAVGVYSMLSPKDFAIEQRRDPALTRARHIMIVGVPYVFFPLLGWIIVEPLGLNIGVFVPVLAWVPLILIGVGFSVVEQVKQFVRR